MVSGPAAWGETGMPAAAFRSLRRFRSTGGWGGTYPLEYIVFLLSCFH